MRLGLHTHMVAHTSNAPTSPAACHRSTTRLPPCNEIIFILRALGENVTQSHATTATQRAIGFKTAWNPRYPRNKAAVSENMHNAKQACQSDDVDGGLRRAKRPSIRCPDTPAKRNVQPVTCPHP